MNRFDRFEHLAKTAREERVPGLDVAAAVRQRIAAEEPEEVWVLAVFGAVSSTAAVVATLLVAWCWSAWTDPLSQFFAQMTLVLQ